ncbi:WD40 repeat-like protein [Saccharata proteae CBS 121410]|uniref:WD40 repeat-like protein n=1 Tax=Saccharata proteae CBS 121410 TaxID=1314787 RepID=A0A9P4HX59_9PEZI|nr:WD40 repeat-like protein [Saccharata proteae CBS 121410]
MADDNLPSSQTFASSPPTSPIQSNARKPKRAPPITPRRFNRFFTPRTTRNGTKERSKSERQLRDITRSAVNRPAKERQTPRRKVVFADVGPGQEENFATPRLGFDKKRKALPSPESSPILPSPSKKARSNAYLSPSKACEFHTNVEVESDAETTILDDDEDLYDDDDDDDEDADFCPPIKRAPTSGGVGRVLQRSFGGSRAIGRGRTYDHCTDWQGQTADFYTGVDDYHTFTGDLPFCVASCNTNSIVAMGDEGGKVVLVDSSKDSDTPFSEPYITMHPHGNAVMDLTFSADDLLLATGSGDQSAQIIDVKTQRTKYIMQGHRASVKQVCFQPGNDNVIATSSRDGTVRLWDMRCHGQQGSIKDWKVSFDGEVQEIRHKVTYASTYNTISGAHVARQPGAASQLSAAQKDTPMKGESPTSNADVSVTALSFITLPGRENLLMTGAMTSTAVKLWDIRGRFSRVDRRCVPVSTTREPESHHKHRQFGINSFSLSSNGSRLYALSRDNTIYAYSTNHLVLGHAPELSSTASSRKAHTGTDKDGLGPLYGFRHPMMHATTFWVKTSVRKAIDDKTELLAVGSSDRCPVLFPTDEAFLNRATSAANNKSPACGSGSPRSILKRSPGSSGFNARMADSIPIFEHGTPLVRGHGNEVSNVAWTSEGELVSIDGDQARELRGVGEAEGRRWGCGWAEVGEGWDDED